MYFKIRGPDCEGCGVYYFSDQPISKKLAHSFLLMVFQWFSMVYPLLYETSRSSMKNYKQPNGRVAVIFTVQLIATCLAVACVVNVHDISSRTSDTFSGTTGSLGIASIGSIAFCHCWKYMEIWGWLPVTQNWNGWFIPTKYSTSNMTLALESFSKGKPLTWNCKSQPMQTLNCQQHVLNHLGWVPRIHVFVLFKSFNEEIHQFSSYSCLQDPGKRVLSFTGQTLNLTWDGLTSISSSGETKWAGIQIAKIQKSRCSKLACAVIFIYWLACM